MSLVNDRRLEFEIKAGRIRHLMELRGWDWLAISSVAAFAWATAGGRAYINSFDSTGVATLLYGREKTVVITSNVEMPRLEMEELRGLPIEYRVVDWTDLYFDSSDCIKDTARRGVLASDLPLKGAVIADGLVELRATLLPNEVQRMRELSSDVALSLEQVARSLKPGQSEEVIAADIRATLGHKAILSPVTLVATDERVFQHRHPLPTEKVLDRYAMLVTSAVKYGLYCSVTRLVHFGEPPSELQDKARACAEVDAAYISATRVGFLSSEIFSQGQQEYAAQGFCDEWMMHHQGGASGYEAREHFVGGRHTFSVNARQCFAWNPSITGVKSEDTIIALEDGPEVLTKTPDWPTIMTARGIARPGILVSG